MSFWQLETVQHCRCAIRRVWSFADFVLVMLNDEKYLVDHWSVYNPKICLNKKLKFKKRLLKKKFFRRITINATIMNYICKIYISRRKLYLVVYYCVVYVSKITRWVSITRNELNRQHYDNGQYYVPHHVISKPYGQFIHLLYNETLHYSIQLCSVAEIVIFSWDTHSRMSILCVVRSIYMFK